ncbi:hypothetical protein ScoT_25870 [Streptomyces albidoflavus]|uniref:Uncharacterized protein n=1 Tax=Streptomyces albidoflavus TaxID=1886 RepID=A0AA37FF50_9ACTN|nr:hypothetical protein ScoT_25870 [Streptomyces albidoflavus]
MLLRGVVVGSASLGSRRLPGTGICYIPPVSAEGIYRALRDAGVRHAENGDRGPSTAGPRSACRASGTVTR